MQRFHNILVGVDLEHSDRLAASELNPPTREAINRAIWVAEQTRAQLTFFSAIELSAKAQSLLEQAGESETTVKTEAEDVLAELVREAKQHEIAASAKLVFGKDWLEIIRQILHEKHDLVIIGTRDLNAAQRFLMGSTGMKLVRNCPCPVWVTRPDPVPEDLNILVASDLSEVSATALDIVVSGGQFLDAKVHLLHALQYPLDGPLWRTGMQAEEVQKYRQTVRESAEETLHEHLARTDYRTLVYGVQTHLIDGIGDTLVLQAIEDHNIDLLVIGTVGRSGIPGVLVGNTAERLLPQVSCSVLAIKPPDFQCPLKLD